MKKITIKNKITGQLYGARMEEPQASEWIEKQKAKSSWGKPERWQKEEDCSEAELARSLETRNVTDMDGNYLHKEHHLPADYEIVIHNLSNDPQWQKEQAIQKRLSEYPSLSECVDALLDDDLEALQKKRLEVKDKYPLPDGSGDKTKADIAWLVFREKRNKALQATDFTQLSDAPLTSTEKGDYRAYRAYLRDLPKQHNNISIGTATIMSFAEWKAANS